MSNLPTPPRPHRPHSINHLPAPPARPENALSPGARARHPDALDGEAETSVPRGGAPPGPRGATRMHSHPIGGTNRMSRIIEVVVSPSGEATVQTRGYAGPSCLQASKFLEEALGVVSTEHRTAEFYQPTQTQQHQGNKA